MLYGATLISTQKLRKGAFVGTALKTAVLTVSDTRTLDTDTSGAFLEEALLAAGVESASSVHVEGAVHGFLGLPRFAYSAAERAVRESVFDKAAAAIAASPRASASAQATPWPRASSREMGLPHALVFIRSELTRNV